MNQEEIVDNVIFEALEVKEPGSGELILNKMTKSTKRDLMLRILGNDRQLYWDYSKIVKKNPPYACAEYSAEIVQMLGKYAKVANTEVKKYGEVMTPLTLVNEMLDTLPKEVWSNPNLKWLDPCNGIGTFPSIIVERLMVGLKDVIIGDCDRYRHIIENMIYVCEIQAKNMFLFHCAFDKEDNYELNTFYGSFLTEEFNEHMNNVWGVEKFDIIVANPPYQSNNPGETKTHPIWDKFVEKSLNILIYSGYLNMVHPSGWRNVDGRFKHIQNMLKNRQVIYLELHGEKDGVKTFGASTTYDFYTLKNSVNNNHITKIKCIDGTYEDVNIFDMEFIPNGKFAEFKKLISTADKVNVIYNRSAYGTDKSNMLREKNKEFKYPCIYTINKDSNIKLFFSNTKDNGHFNTPKVIWTNGAASTPIVDKNGDYGLCQFSYAIVDEVKNLNEIYNAMMHPKFIELMKYTDGMVHRYNRKIIGTFRKDFYKQFLND